MAQKLGTFGFAGDVAKMVIDTAAGGTAQGVATALKAAGNKPLTISVHSYGGDAMAGVAIHNMLARHPAQKTVVVDGIAASAASLIAMAGDRIVMPSNAFLMIHNASGLSYGTAADARDVADILDNISAAYRRTYAAKTGLPEDEIGALMDAETWLTADEAVAKGFATEAAEPAEIRMDASRLLSMPNLPAALAAITRPAVPALVEEQRAMEPEANIVQPPVMAAPTVPAPVVPQAPAPASLAETDRHASAVLAARWPNVPNLGDLRLVEAADECRQYVRRLQVEVVARAVEIGRHGRDPVPSVLLAVSLDVVDAADLRHRVGLIGGLERACHQR